MLYKSSSDIIVTRRYGPLAASVAALRGPTLAEAFFALRAKKEIIMLFWPSLGNIWCPVVTLVTFSTLVFQGLVAIQES